MQEDVIGGREIRRQIIIEAFLEFVQIYTKQIFPV